MITLITFAVILWLLWGAIQFILSIPVGNWTITDKFMDFYLEKANWLGKIVLAPVAVLIAGPGLIVVSMVYLGIFLGTILIKKEHR